MPSDHPAELPEPQRLALAWCPRAVRADTRLLLELDARLGAIVATRREPLAAQLRLAWWRETLERPVAGWPRGEPLLDSLRQWRDPAPLADLPEGWEHLLGERLDEAALAGYAAGRGAGFAALAEQLGTGHGDEAALAGQVWALADLAAHLADPDERALAVARGRALGRPPRLPRKLRPLAVLAALGASALAKGGVPLLDGPRGALTVLRVASFGR